LRVWMTPRALKVFEKAPQERQDAVQRRMEWLADDADHHFPADQFKPQGAFPAGGGKEIRIKAFKAHQLRVYGGVPIGGRDYVFTDADIKKQNDADRELLRNAAKRVGNLTQKQLDELAKRIKSSRE